MIHTRELSRRFTVGSEVVHAVRGIDLDVRPGEVVALLGPNGAGKSTMLRMLTTLLPPTGGTAQVVGHDVVADATQVRRRIGLIGQGNGSLPGMRVHDELVNQGRLYGLPRREATARAGDLLERLELGQQARRDVGALSGGQRRRLDIAMGLIHRPELIFLDEPTAALDPQSRANLWEHLQVLHKEHDTTIVFSTHYLDEADGTAERIVVIDHGQVIADGTPDALKQQVAGDQVWVDLGPDGPPRAAAVLRDVAGVDRIAVSDASDGIIAHVRDGVTAVPTLMGALLERQVPVHGIQVSRPSLDDVFLSLTGRSLRDD